MGHLRLGHLPLRFNWRQVVAALGDAAADPKQVAAVTARAASGGLRGAANDAGVVYPFWFLLRLADSSHEPEAWNSFLRSSELTGAESALGFQAAVTEHVRATGRATGRRTAFGDIGLESFRVTLRWALGRESLSLFGASPDELRLALRASSAGKGLARLSAHYLGDFFARCLSYFVSFEISNHLGVGRRFHSLAGAQEFAEALRVYSSDVSRLAEDFSSGWYSAERWRSGDVTPEATRRFLHVAFRKFQQQLEREVQ